MSIRSLLVMIYSAGLALTGFIFKRVKARDRAVLLVSFPDNARALLDEYVSSSRPFEMEVLYTRHAVSLADEYPSVRSQVINEKNPIHLIKAVHRMFSCKFVLTDNYFLLTSVLNKRPQTTCIQIWHASGALKKFGLEDIGNRYRSAGDIKRFKKVYRSFDYIAVGSEKMADIFKRSFGVEDDRFLRTGVPLTDEYFHAGKQTADRPDQKVILYAPTYRDYCLTSVRLPFSKEQLSGELKGEFLLLVKLHPAVREQITFEEHEGLIKDVSDVPLKDLLMESDILISDYSSVAFEYALLNKPILFFTYDMAEYNEKRGLIDNFEAVIPGKACMDSEMLLKEIKEMSDTKEEIKRFAQEWHQYSTGDASMRLLNFMSEHMTANEKRPAGS
ncbi:CDP-glycerol glycerophosphotransferase family protein [Bacillus haynesii]|uniref:CDP-glycerol glycerophosphotransferase family protein n=1 Tax=Bacillus haynesii TaxID=1925021 RepID=UPI00227E7EC5|nr:CDP-glycerol glycerophosphotransferase family protein [Bacillus haynesii]MCY7814325.1 CDP-glycerol glycerophosphotransferase family protein [Bacillus haynesii]MCY8222244.1 CDP-glycerol glycerophosphotransferase family protein [Bacillus haynesii]MCY8240275.1 CDP-glycerol glycerophosphotransferase family protein [Bacillus haynesii]MCY8568404.1 CDP-glycerol glycerophosphotransferase family protein [Bacillus haynesii]MCY8662770.1 CDP-glycerol glycerophosphotransferase family protein [Bacillus h